MQERLDDPYFYGAGRTPDGSVLPVIIDGRSYLIDTSRQTNLQERFRRTSLQLLNTQQNPEKGESGLTPPEVWRRKYESWHRGMGQTFADREDSDRYRYDWSKGIDPWEKWQVGLLNDTSLLSDTDTIYGVQAKGHTVGLAPARGSVFVTDGALTTSFSLPSPSHIATDGYYVYAFGDDHKLRRLSIANSGLEITVTVTATSDATGITESTRLLVMANFKLLVIGNSGTVWDITNFINPSGTPVLQPAIYTPPTPYSVFVAGCAGKKAIYLMESCGCRTTIHAFELNRNSGEGQLDVLLYSGVAAELPDGEVGHTLYNYLGYIAIGTSKGFRFAAVGEGITYGPLIETTGPVTAFEGQGRFLYYSLSGFHDDNGLGRADLSEFVADLQPAYASDLMSGVDGDTTVTFINTLPDGKLIFGLADGGIYVQNDTYVESGTIRLSAWTFNVVDPKVGLYVMTTNSTDSGGSGALSICYDQTGTLEYLGNAVSSGAASQKFPLIDSKFGSAGLVTTLSANTDRSKTPLVYGVEMRATYVRGKASEWQVPCILHDTIEMDNGTVQDRDIVADFEHLFDLYETGRTFIYREDDRQWQVYATDFIWSPHERSIASGWQGVYTIYFREVR